MDCHERVKAVNQARRELTTRFEFRNVEASFAASSATTRWSPSWSPPWVILLGYVPGVVLRGLMVGAIVLILAMFFTTVRIPHPLVTLSTVLLAATVFSLAGFVNAVYAKKFDDIAIVPTFVLTPLTYLGGVFYSVNLLPDWAERLSRAKPILYMVNAFRYGLLGSSDVNLGQAFGVTLTLCVVLVVAGLELLRRGVGLCS